MRIAILIVLAIGCSSPRMNTTRLTARDIDELAGLMASDLLADPVIRSRSRDSRPWIVTLHRAENRTAHAVTDGERLYPILDLRHALTDSGEMRARNIEFVIPYDEWERLARLRGEEVPASARLVPTHVLDAAFLGARSDTHRQRTDIYRLEFRLTVVATGQLLWNHAYKTTYSIRKRKHG